MFVLLEVKERTKRFFIYDMYSNCTKVIQCMQGISTQDIIYEALYVNHINLKSLALIG